MWVLISITKRSVFRIWLGFLFVIMAISFLQSLTGQLEGMLGLAWLWSGVNLLPGFTVLLVSMLLDRQTPRLIPGNAHRMLLMLTTFYLSFVLLSLMSETYATMGTLSMQAYRIRSFMWLIPLQLVTLSAFYVLFFRKGTIFKPDGAAISAVAEKEAQKWMAKGDELRKQYYRWIAEGRTEEVLQQVSQRWENRGGADLEELTLLQNQFYKNQNDQSLNLVSQEHAQITYNRITVALMELIKK